MTRKKRIIIFSIIVFVLAIGAGGAAYMYSLLNKPIVAIPDNKSSIIYIPSGSGYQDVLDSLEQTNAISDMEFLKLIAEKKNYPNKVKAGRYELRDGMTANALINMLRSGNQKAIKLTFNNIRFLPKLAGIVSNKLELDSAKLMLLLTDEEYLAQLGYKKETAISLFLPNTYELWWNTDEEAFIERMKSEHDKFWNKKRLKKAQAMNMSPTEVATLASIIQEETNKTDEMSRMTGVLMNRLRAGMLLQVDPTARFAYGDFSVKRITYDYLKIDSPYNTYIYPGLPPGPICMPNPSTIDRVLDYETHKYFYYCAKADNSGYHAFAKNLSEHNRNARKYHRYLNQQRVYR